MHISKICCNFVIEIKEQQSFKQIKDMETTIKTLTKKQFANALTNNKTALIFAKLNLHKDITDTIIKSAQEQNERLQKNGHFRDVETVAPTFIKFSDGSKMYFERGTKYLLANDKIILAVRKYKDSFDFANLWQILVYLIKE